MSIATRILLLIGIVLQVVGAGWLFNGLNLRQQRLDEAQSETIQLVRVAEANIGGVLQGVHQVLKTLSLAVPPQGWDERTCASLTAVAAASPRYDHLHATDRNGIIQCSSNGSARVGAMVVDRELFDRAIATGDFVVGSYGTGAVSGKEVIRFAQPVFDKAGTTIGAVYAGVSLAWLDTEIDNWRLGANITIDVTDRNGILIARHPSEVGVGTPIAAPLKPFLSERDVGSGEVRDLGGVDRIYGYVPVAAGNADGVGVFVGREKAIVLGAIHRTMTINAAVILACLLLAFVFALLYVRRFVNKPLQRLLVAADHWSGGDWSHRAAASAGIPELDRLAVAFDGMAIKLGDRDRELVQRDALLYAVATSASEIMSAASLDDAIPRVLELVTPTIQVDRITVLDRAPAPNMAPAIKFAWQVPDLKFVLDNKFFQNPALMTPQVIAWQAPLWDGKAITADLRTASDGIKAMLQSVGTETLLVLPILVDGKYWGNMGFESCRNQRDWSGFEIGTLQLLADLIGNAIQRDRYVKELADANRIVQNTPTILFRLGGTPSLPMFYVSRNVNLLGYDPAALTASPTLYQSLIHPDDRAAVREVMGRLVEKDSHSGTIEFRLMTSHGDYRWVENRFSPVHDAAGRLIEIEGLLYDITERRAAEAKIALLARTDPLTGLPNRTTFIDRLQRAFAAARHGASGFAVLFLDIDRFKDINDSLGHPVGDRLLILVGERLRNSVRESDTVARFGGDEFAILQTELSEASDAGALATKIRAALAEPLQIGGNDINISASIGISIFASDILVPEDMLANADVALYRAKDEGRDQYRFHTEALDIEVREHVALSDDLRLALSRGEFTLDYQPQVQLSTGWIVGMEALIRWNHPTRGLLLPAAFIEVAERTGTINAIGQWVIDRACQQMHAWHLSGIAPNTIAVNISSIQLRASDKFVEFVTDTLEKWQLKPADLELDVTESVLARAALTQNRILERLEKLGVRISIDDFGTKYSSLGYLRAYHVHRIKIPQLLMDSAAHDPADAAMLRSIVGMARELNIEVVAQKVATKAQWSFLTATSPATTVQGFYYSAPVPADAAERLLRGGRIDPGEDRRQAAALALT